MATLSLLCRIHQKRIAFRYFIHEIHLRYQLGLIYPCFLCVLKAAWRGLTVAVSLCCVNSFWYVASLRLISQTAWKVSKYGVYSGPYFPVFGLEKIAYLYAFHAVREWNFGNFFGHISPLKMKRKPKFDAFYLNQEFNVDLENLFSFNQAPGENRLTTLFLKSDKIRGFWVLSVNAEFINLAPSKFYQIWMRRNFLGPSDSKRSHKFS